MIPDFEVIMCEPSESFRWTVHEYPHQLAKWHHHPEYELHLIQETAGQMRIGDFVGPFSPGNLILTGPYLPHNWLSNAVPPGGARQRDMLIQFTQGFADRVASFAELQTFARLLEDATFGVEFLGDTRGRAIHLLRGIGAVRGLARLELFFELAGVLASTSSDRRLLSKVPGSQRLTTPEKSRLRIALDFIYRNFQRDVPLAEVARLVHMEPSTFSRYFKRQTGHNFSQFVIRSRVYHACRLLSNSDRSVTDICFESGFNNTANFNRQFLSVCGHTPSEYRSVANAVATRNGATRIFEWTADAATHAQETLHVSPN